MEEQRALGAHPDGSHYRHQSRLDGTVCRHRRYHRLVYPASVAHRLGSTLAENGSFLAPIIYGILLGGITFAENMFFVKTGYRMGTQAALSVLEGGAINKFISCASVLGMFMMGGLSASMVKVYTSAQIPTGEGTVMAIRATFWTRLRPGCSHCLQC